MTDNLGHVGSGLVKSQKKCYHLILDSEWRRNHCEDIEFSD